MFLLDTEGQFQGANFGVSLQMRRHDLQVAPALGIPWSPAVQRPGVRWGRNPWDSGDSGLTLRGPQLLHDGLGRSLLGPCAGLHYLVAAAWLAEHVWGLQCRLPLGRQIQVLLCQVRTQLPDLKLQEAEGLQVGMPPMWERGGTEGRTGT